jgi:hypothetical protein
MRGEMEKPQIPSRFANKSYRAQCYKTFYSCNLEMIVISKCLSLAGFSSLV